MKKGILIPHRKAIYVVPYKKPIKAKYIEEKKPLGEVCRENGCDMKKMAKLINLSFLLSDIIEGMILDVEAELHKVDPTLAMDLRHPISRIKIHTKEMVRFVDETMKNENASYDFAEKSDAIRAMVEEFADNIHNRKNNTQ